MNYETLSQCALESSLSIHESELHGIISALCVAHGQLDAAQIPTIMDEILPVQLNHDALVRFYRATFDALDEANLSYQLLIDNDSPLSERVEAVSFWVNGFIHVFEKFGFWESQCDPQLLPEVRDDFEEIAKIDKNVNEAQTEENEEALMQILEYLRIATLQMFEYTQCSTQP